MSTWVFYFILCEEISQIQESSILIAPLNLQRPKFAVDESEYTNFNKNRAYFHVMSYLMYIIILLVRGISIHNNYANYYNALLNLGNA